MDVQSLNFVHKSDLYAEVGMLICVAIGIIILLYHEIKVIRIKDLKAKYDYVNLYEIRHFWYAVVAFLAAAGFFFNSIGTRTVISHGMLWLYVRIFVAAGIVVIGYVMLYGLVKIYYPHFLEKRLVRLRETPRISPTGNKMRKLSEQEEDTHLDESQIEEEANVQSVDYDVWLDDKTGYKKIEKYISSQHAEQCPNCGFYTMQIVREEVEQKPTQTQEGMLMKHYKCGYCKHREKREVKIACLQDNVA